MLAEKDTIFDDAAVTIRRLTEDEKIRMQCEAREDYWRREHGVRSRLRDEKRKNARLEKKLAEKENVIAEKEAKLAEKDTKLAEKDEEIARLRIALEEKG